MAIFNGGSFNDRMYGHNKLSDWDGRNDDMFGHGGNDEMFGMRGNDRLFGGAGKDLLVGGEGNDDIFGDGGNDIMTYESGRDTFSGGSGTDTLQFRDIAFVTTNFDAVASVLTFGRAKGIDYDVATGAVREVGGGSLGSVVLNSVEKLTFTGHGDIVTDDHVGRRIETFGGSDTVFAGAGADNVDLGEGSDVVDGGRGDDILGGGLGTDEISFSSWNDVTVPAGQTLSTLISLTGPFATAGGSRLVSSSTSGSGSSFIESDTIFGFENVTATKFNDTITGSDLINRISGEGGNDVIIGRGGKDTLTGGDGNDRISGGAAADVMNGGAGNDTLDYATSSAGVTINLVNGRGRGGDAEGDRATSFENIIGSRHADELTGSTRANILRGGDGSDTIDGLHGNDTIDGGAGRDFLTGGIGQDRLTGGAGNDDFIFKAANDTRVGAGDTITDFTRGADRIDLSAIDAILGNAGNDHFTAFTPVFVQSLPGEPPIPVTFLAGSLVLTSSAFDANNDGTADSFMNIVSGHVDGDSVGDFELQVVTSFDTGRLTGSDFLL